jgi:hypothetical protein
MEQEVPSNASGLKRKSVFAPSPEPIEDLVSSFVAQVVEKPEVFLNAHQSTKDQILVATKTLYDYGTFWRVPSLL